MRVARNVVLAAAAFAVLLAFGGVAEAQNKCLAGKIKCVSKKKSCRLGVISKGYKTGAIDPAKLQKCEDKFDGGADPSKGCFTKLDVKNDGPCISFGGTANFESKVDAFVADVQEELDPGSVVSLDACTAAKLKCVSKKDKCILNVHGKAAKTGSPPDLAKLQKCQDKFDGGADPTKGCFEKAEAKALDACTSLDDTAALEAKIDAFDADVLAELQAPPTACGVIDNRRCTGNTRTECGTNADCAGAGGTCEFYFGAPLALAAGGVSTCVTNQFNGPISGTFNELTGSAAGTALLLSRVFSGPVLAQPCPRCVGDSANNDGFRGGTCDSGANASLTCDGNGTSTFEETFGTTSLDCPPLSGGAIADLSIDLSNTTGTRTDTLTAASPNCRAVGFTSLKCFCDTCNDAAAYPCNEDADCADPPGPIGPICGGQRCVGGGNGGQACTAPSECPGGACTRPGVPTKPNDCDDSTCSPDGGNEGTCAGGPFETFCTPVEVYRGCSVNGDCSFPGDTCSLGKFRECFTDNGLIGATVSATGVADPPVGNESDPTLATLYCIGPTTAPAVNSGCGLPGEGRLELPGHATDNGDATNCPTVVDFLPTPGDAGVLDPGWTGHAHDSKVISCGLTTVSVTGCSNGPTSQPDCGVCSYVGPIANPGAP